MAGTVLNTLQCHVCYIQFHEVGTIIILMLWLRKQKLREVNVTNFKCQSSDLSPGWLNQRTRKHTHRNKSYFNKLWIYGKCSIRNMKQEQSTVLGVNRYFSDGRKAKHEGSRSDAKTSLAVHFINGLEETE